MSMGSMYLTSALSSLVRRSLAHGHCIRRLLPTSIAKTQAQAPNRTRLSACAVVGFNNWTSARLQHSEAVAPSEDVKISEAELKADAVLTSLSPERAKKLKVLQLELDVLQEYGQKVPEKIRPSWWLQLLDLETPSARRKFYRYLRKIESQTRNRERQREKKRLLREETKDEPTRTSYLADNMRNSIHMHVRQQTMNMFYNSRLAHTMVFGPHLVIDLSLDDHMQTREHINVVDQILIAHGYNKLEQEPFDLVLTSAHSDNPIMQAMEKSCNALPLNKLMITTTEKSFLEVYPKDRLVYLTPNAPMELTEYNPDDVYIIGGFVDKSNPKPLTMAKAKQHNIRMAKFPLDKFLLWMSGSKSLTIDQAIKIMLDLKNKGSWEVALKHVPKRKLLPK